MKRLRRFHVNAEVFFYSLILMEFKIFHGRKSLCLRICLYLCGEYIIKISMSYNLLKGKRGIVFGALNEQSIAWKVAEKSC